MSNNDKKKESNKDNVDSKFKEEINNLKMKLEKEKEEKEECLDGWKRIKADFLNYKKDESERMKSVSKKIQEPIFKDIVSVLDSFNLGLSMTKDKNVKKEDVCIIRDQLENVIKKHGVLEIKVDPGDNFNPSEHEAIEEVTSNFSSGKVVEIVETGYILGERVLRPVKVKVSK